MSDQGQAPVMDVMLSSAMQRVGTGLIALLRRACPGIDVTATIRPTQGQCVDGVEVVKSGGALLVRAGECELFIGIAAPFEIVAKHRWGSDSFESYQDDADLEADSLDRTMREAPAAARSAVHSHGCLSACVRPVSSVACCGPKGSRGSIP
jgi:hypothetical protein